MPNLGTRYIIEATDTGYALTVDSGHKTIGMRLEAHGGHDLLEELYAKAETTWHQAGQQYQAQREGVATPD